MHKLHISRLCGGRYYGPRSDAFRRVKGGFASDWLGLIVWVDRP